MTSARRINPMLIITPQAARSPPDRAWHVSVSRREGHLAGQALNVPAMLRALSRAERAPAPITAFRVS